MNATEAELKVPPTNPGSVTPTPTSKFEVTLQAPTAPHTDFWTEFAAYVAWPIAAVAIAYILRNTLSSLLHRATKFSVGVFAVELAETTARSFAIPDFDEIQETASPGDSSRQLTLTINDESPADYARINLGSGRSWLTSRLYLLATLGPPMRGMRSVVFEGAAGSNSTSDAGPSKYIGVVDAENLADALARRYPWLKVALVTAYNSAFSNLVPSTMLASQLSIGNHGRLDPLKSEGIVSAFKKALQKPVGGGADWVNLGPKWERATWVSEVDLKALLGDRLATEAAVRQLSTSDEELARQVLRGTGRLVPVVNVQRELLSVVNRGNLLSRIARLVADQR